MVGLSSLYPLYSVCCFQSMISMLPYPQIATSSSSTVKIFTHSNGITVLKPSTMELIYFWTDLYPIKWHFFLIKSCLLLSVTLILCPFGISSTVFKLYPGSNILVFISEVKYCSMTSSKSFKLFSLKNFKLLYTYTFYKMIRNYIKINVFKFL